MTQTETRTKRGIQPAYRGLSTDEMGVLLEYHEQHARGAGAALSRLPTDEDVRQSGMKLKAFTNHMAAAFELKAARAERNHDDFMVDFWLKLAEFVRQEHQFPVSKMITVSDR